MKHRKDKHKAIIISCYGELFVSDRRRYGRRLVPLYIWLSDAYTRLRNVVASKKPFHKVYQDLAERARVTDKRFMNAPTDRVLKRYLKMPPPKVFVPDPNTPARGANEGTEEADGSTRFIPPPWCVKN